jgi:hypothetical protein
MRFLTIISGTYVDRRDERLINASRIIWILACNALDQVITDYFKKRDVSSISSPEVGHSVASGLQDRLTSTLEAKFGVRVYSRSMYRLSNSQNLATVRRSSLLGCPVSPIFEGRTGAHCSQVSLRSSCFSEASKVGSAESTYWSD